MTVFRIDEKELFAIGLSRPAIRALTSTIETVGSLVGSTTVFGANSFIYANSSGQLVSTGSAIDGELLIGRTGLAPNRTTLSGTANQITVTNGAGTITLGTPQSIGTGSSPSFTGLTVSGLTASKIVWTDGSKNLTSTAAGQTANTIYAGPNSGAAAAPAFRALTQADLPVMPSFSAHLNGTNQTGIVSANFTKIQFSGEDFDTNSNFDSTTNYRFTPTVAGKYLLTWIVIFTAGVDQTRMLAALFKNGIRYKDSGHSRESGTGAIGASGSAVVDANGSTDYFEIYAYQESGANQDIVGATSGTSFTGVMVSR